VRAVGDRPFASLPFERISRSSQRGFFEFAVVPPPWNIRNRIPFPPALTAKN
jgi:hypothetical protein